MKLVNESIYGSYNRITKLSTYTKVKSAESILDNYNLRLYPLAEVNDLKEGVYYQGDIRNAYCLCFTFSNQESIPMWYLYGGADGKGIRITLPYKNFIDYISKVETGEVALYDNNRKRVNPSDIAIFHGPISYMNQRIQKDTKPEKLFFKLSEWDYEKEYRIMIMMKNGQNPDYLRLNFKALSKEVSVLLGPEYDKNNYFMDNKIRNSSAICKVLNKQKTSKCSKLVSNMKLTDSKEYILESLRRHPEFLMSYFYIYGEQFIEFINQAIEEYKYEVALDKMKKALNVMN